MMSFKKIIFILLIIIIGMTLFFDYIDGPPNERHHENELDDPEIEDRSNDIDLSPDEDPFRDPVSDPGNF